MTRRARQKKALSSQEPQIASVDALSHEGRGIARIAGKTVFIEGALPGEEILFRYTRQHSKFDEGCVVKVLQPALARVEPGCRHFGVCGGCSLQHISTEAQLQLKQDTLKEQFQHFGGINPEQWLSPIAGFSWEYRRKARLGVKFVKKKNRVFVGFREKRAALLLSLSVARCCIHWWGRSCRGWLH